MYTQKPIKYFNFNQKLLQILSPEKNLFNAEINLFPLFIYTKTEFNIF